MDHEITKIMDVFIKQMYGALDCEKLEETWEDVKNLIISVVFSFYVYAI